MPGRGLRRPWLRRKMVSTLLPARNSNWEGDFSVGGCGGAVELASHPVASVAVPGEQVPGRRGVREQGGEAGRPIR